MTELLAQIRKKDKAAVTILYQRYGKNLYGYAVSRWNLDEDEAWELVYKTLYKIMEVADRYVFEDEKKFGGFIFRTFVNNLRNHYHEKKSKHVEVVELQDKHGSPEERPEEEDKPLSKHMHLLQEELAQLEDWKKILLLMRAQNYSYEEIGKYVNKPPEQMKVYYGRLKKALMERINEKLGE